MVETKPATVGFVNKSFEMQGDNQIEIDGISNGKSKEMGSGKLHLQLQLDTFLQNFGKFPCLFFNYAQNVMLKAFRQNSLQKNTI